MRQASCNARPHCAAASPPGRKSGNETITDVRVNSSRPGSCRPATRRPRSPMNDAASCFGDGEKERRRVDHGRQCCLAEQQGGRETTSAG